MGCTSIATAVVRFAHARIAVLVALACVAAAAAPAPAEADGFTVYVVRPGDSLSQIADDAGVSVASIVALNAIADADRVQPGTRLVLSRSAGSPAPATTLEVSAVATSSTRAYRVQPGDTLSSIADELGVDVGRLAEVNGIADADLLRDGLVLDVPAAASGPVVRPKHVVSPGETLTDIAAEYSVSLAELAAANRLADPSRIRIGAELVIPAKALPIPPASVRGAIGHAAAASDLDPYLLLALSYVESGWQMDAISSTGAVGFMQLMPDTARWVNMRLAPGPTNWRASIADNTRVGAAYLAHLVELGDGDLRWALGAYYQGWASLNEDGPLRETRRYVDDILALTARFRALGSLE